MKEFNKISEFNDEHAARIGEAMEKAMNIIKDIHPYKPMAHPARFRTYEEINGLGYVMVDFNAILEESGFFYLKGVNKIIVFESVEEAEMDFNDIHSTQLSASYIDDNGQLRFGETRA